MVKLLKKDGMILVTCAGEGRAEHGTTRTSPEDAPYTNDYYQNFNETMLREAIDMEKTFWDYEISNEELDFRFF